MKQRRTCRISRDCVARGTQLIVITCNRPCDQVCSFVLWWSEMAYSVEERARSTAWFEWKQNILVQRKFHAEYGKNRNGPVHQYESGMRCCCQREAFKRQKEEADLPDLLKMWLECSITSPIILTPQLAERPPFWAWSSHASIHRMLRTNEWYPYKEHVMQKLHDEDYANRIEFARDELDWIAGVQCTWRFSFSLMRRIFISTETSIRTKNIILSSLYRLHIEYLTVDCCYIL